MATDGERAFAAVSRMRNLMFRHAGAPIRGAGLTVSQFEVLEALSAHGPMPVGRIVREVFGTPGNIPLVIKNLERDGLVSRSASAEDGRVSVVGLTEEGRRRVEGVYPEVVASIDRDLSVLDTREKRQLTALLHKAFKAASAAEGSEG